MQFQHNRQQTKMQRLALWQIIALITVSFMVAFLYSPSALAAHKKKYSHARSHRHKSSSSMPMPLVDAEKYSAVVVDYNSGHIIYSHNADAPRYPASLTKMMTLYLVFEALDNGRLKLHQPMSVSEHAASQQPSHLGLKPGQTITVEQAILGVVTRSANDAATVFAETIGGNEAEFCQMMTLRARSLGMEHTHYFNASGLPHPGQQTTADDYAKLSLAMLKHFPHYYHYFNTREFEYHNQAFLNHNHLLGVYQGIDGIKTGYIHQSGFNMVASAMRGGKRVVAIVFGGTSARGRDKQVVELLDQAFEKLGVVARQG